MTFYETLDSIMKQDFGGRGLLASLPASPLAAVSASLAHAKRAVLLTGFPVRMPDGSITGETDGPSGTANLAAALTAAGCGVSVVTDWSSYPASGSGSPLPRSAGNLDPSAGTEYG